MFRYFTILLLFPVVVYSAGGCVHKPVKTPDGPTCGKQQTIANVGECLCCYNDTKGIPTIRIGLNIKPASTVSLLAKYGYKRANILKDCQTRGQNYCITDAVAKKMLEETSYVEAERCADQFATGLTGIKRAAIVDMAMMGCPTLKTFTDLQAALKSKNW